MVLGSSFSLGVFTGSGFGSTEMSLQVSYQLPDLSSAL